MSLEQRPDKIEPKLLVGGEIAPRWHWGLNFWLIAAMVYSFARVSAVCPIVGTLAQATHGGKGLLGD